MAGPPPKWTTDKIEPNYSINVNALLTIPFKFNRACTIRRSTLSNTMHYKWESAYSLQMNISLSVIALTVSAAAILVLCGAGTHSSVETVYAQVNVLPGTEEPANTTSGEGGVGSTTAPTAGPRFNAGDIAQTNSMKLDSDVHNLVVLIPDKRLVNQGFLPLDATIVEGTKVIWSNADNSTMSPQVILTVFHLSKTAIIRFFSPMGPYRLGMRLHIRLTPQERIHFQIPRTQIQQLLRVKSMSLLLPTHQIIYRQIQLRLRQACS